MYGQILPKKKNQIRIRQLLKYPKGNDASYVEIIGDSHVILIVTPFVTELINPTSSTGNPVTQVTKLEVIWRGFEFIYDEFWYPSNLSKDKMTENDLDLTLKFDLTSNDHRKIDHKEIYFNLFRRKKRRECSDLVDEEYKNCLLEIVPQSQLDLGCNYPLGKEIKGFRPRKLFPPS